MNNFREMTQSHNTELTLEAMQQNAPSVFAQQPHEEVSNRYGFVPTIQVIEGLKNEGWLPVDATQKNVRKADKQDFTKHLIRFRRLNDDIRVGDSAVELLLTNSHDRSAAFVLHAGIFRMACANGIVIADSTFNKISVRHNQNALEDVIEGSYQVLEEVPLITNEVESMQGIQLNRKEQEIFADAALGYMIPELQEEESKIITSKDSLITQALRPKRAADTGSDLWSTYNVLQEKALRGGLSMHKRGGKGGYRRNTTRKVKSIDKDVKLNKALWEMAIQMKELKAA